MRRLLMAAIVALAATLGAKSEPNVPDIASASLAYRQSLPIPSDGTTVASLLAAIKQAENERNLLEAVRLYERLVSLQPDSFRSWLKLGLAWKEVDKSSDGGAKAAWNAYRSARAVPDQLEALLLMSSILRSQLATTSESYEKSRADVADLNRALRDEQRGGQIPCPTAAGAREAGSGVEDRTGSVALQCASRAAATEEMERDAGRIGSIAHDLDEIYSDLVSKFPGLDLERLQRADQREKEFAPAAVLENGAVNFSFKLTSGATQSCVEFTQELDPDASVYARHASAKYQPKGGHPTDANSDKPPPPALMDEDAKKASNWSLSVDGRRLCFENLAAGASYRVVLKKGLPSKLGMKLTKDIDQVFDVPDYPKQIRFAGGRFVLPRSGSGAIDIHATNLRSVDLELYRISDRTLYRQIALGLIGGSRSGSAALPEEEYQGLSDHFGELLWRGSLAMPSRWKPNEWVGAQLKARDLLEMRRDWLKHEVEGGRKPGNGVLSSGVRPMFAASEDEAGLSGEFFADRPEFETATRDLENPGVYAFVAQPSNPSRCAKAGEEDKQSCERPVQWLVMTDIGVTFYEGADTLSVALRSLETGEAVRAKVQLVTASNRVLGQEIETDQFGVARFPRSLTAGTQSNALAAIMAQKAGDFAFLPFNAERLDLSKLNVDGRTLPQGIDAYLTTDRGLYEPGQAIQLFALLRDGQGRASKTPSSRLYASRRADGPW